MKGDDRPGTRPRADGPVTRGDAVEVARRALAERGVDVEVYEVSVAEREDDWLVSFEPHPPAPPGRERAVFVEKSGGATRIVQGE